eukprot:m.62403 g.62403  ORF g.62403 m.62403 type:complete len:222 (-) comp13388_c1_seq3:664-1329(-)
MPRSFFVSFIHGQGNGDQQNIAPSKIHTKEDTLSASLDSFFFYFFCIVCLFYDIFQLCINRTAQKRAVEGGQSSWLTGLAPNDLFLGRFMESVDQVIDVRSEPSNPVPTSVEDQGQSRGLTTTDRSLLARAPSMRSSRSQSGSTSSSAPASTPGAKRESPPTTLLTAGQFARIDEGEQQQGPEPLSLSITSLVRKLGYLCSVSLAAAFLVVCLGLLFAVLF